MKIHGAVLLSLAISIGFASACGPKSGGDRLPGARGIADAGERFFDFLCECEAPEEAGVCEEGDAGYFGDIDVACIDRVLADFPADRQIAQCQVDATYDLVECYEAAGCPPEGGDVVVQGPTQSDGGEPEPPEAAHPTEACEDTYSQAVEEACGEISDAALARIESECDLGGNEECLTAEGGGVAGDCGEAPPRDAGQSSPGCNPDVESCGSDPD
ncbi:MAG: hypothetical protein AAF721_10270 [Myxococcota bacterium]